MDRKFSFSILLAVIGLSIVFGLVIGGRLNAPRVMLAAPDHDWLEAATDESSVRSAEATDFSDIAERALPAVVGVESTTVIRATPEDQERAPGEGDPFHWFFRGPADRQEVSFGSGFIISPQGHILTNYHVVRDARRLTVKLWTGKRFEAEVVGTDPSIDLALIKIDNGGEPLPTLTLGSSSGLRVGEWVLAVGNPLGLEISVTVGVVSGKSRNSLPIGGTDTLIANFIQTDAAINKGNSGGPLLDAGGRVIGINTAILRYDVNQLNNPLVEGVGFALPIDVARDAVEQLLSTGAVHRGFLGIAMNPAPLDEDAQEYYGLPDTHGVLITNVIEDLPAERAGLVRDDVIRQVDGEPVRNNDELVAAVATRKPGETVTLGIIRSASEHTIEVTLDERRPQGPVEPELPPPVEPTAGKGLGIEVEELTAEVRKDLRSGPGDGVVVSNVDLTSIAGDKGVQRAMVITALNGRTIDSVDAWQAAMDVLKTGELVKIDLRFGRQDSVVVLRVPED